VTTLTKVGADYTNPHLRRTTPMSVATLIKKLQTCEPSKPVRLIVDGFNKMDMPHFGVTEDAEDVCLGRFDFTQLDALELPE
jgi:hypothetical protein